MKANELSIGWALTQPDPAAAVQRAIENVRNWEKAKAQAVVRIGSALTRLDRWSRQPSATFTALCATRKGEVFTHGDVVRAHLYLVAVVVIMCVAGWLEGGAA